MSDNLLRPDEAALLLNCSERLIKDELRRKNLRGIKTPAGWRIERADLETYKNAKANVSTVRRPA
jgi:excisionase family DNA binding protein